LTVTVADLDALRERLTRALDAVEDMTRAMIGARGGTKPDAYGLVGEDIVAGTSLDEALEVAGHFDPIEVQGVAVVERFWAVRVPVADGNGDLEGTEIMRFPTQAAADAFVAEAEAAGAEA